MKQVDKYLRTVRFFLPAGQQDDIIAELAEDLRTQIDDLQNERGRNLDPTEIAALLRKRGSPIAVAGNYLPQNQLIGPAFYPIYRFVLKMVVLWIQVPLFLCIIGPLKILASTDAFAATLQTLGQLFEAAFVAFGVITIVFALVEQPKILINRKKSIARRTSITDLINAAFRIALWIYVVQQSPRLDVSGIHIVLAPIWSTVFWPILFLLICDAAVRLTGVLSPAHARSQTLARLSIDGAALAVILYLLSAGTSIQISAPGLTVETLASASKWANINALIVILGAAIAVGIAAFKEWRNLPKQIQNSGEFPANLG